MRMPNDRHEEGPPSEVETNELNDDSSQEQGLPSDSGNWRFVAEDNHFENGWCTKEGCQGQLLTWHQQRVYIRV